MVSQAFKDSFKSAAKDPKTGRRPEPRWDDHDAKISAALKLYADTITAAFDGHLTAVIKDAAKTLHVERLTLTYSGPPFALIKAMIWIESGGPTNAAWNGKAMQIGVPGDPGLTTLRSGGEGARWILPDDVKAHLDAKSINTPEGNIRAGIGYYLAKHARKTVPENASIFDYSLALSSGPPPPPATLVWNSHHDVLDTVARSNHTTYEVLLCLNGAARPSDLKNGQTLKFYAARHGSYITGFKDFSAANAATLYNGGGDPDYEDKLKFVMGLI